MLPDNNRLKNDEDFESVKDGGKLYQKALFGVVVKNRKDKNPTRFGFIVSKKIAKHAVLRNRVRRALRESVRHELTYVKNGFDVVFLAKRASLKAMTEGIMSEVKIALKETGVV